MENTKRDLKIPESYNYIALFLTMRCNLKCSFCLNSFDGGFDRKRFPEADGESWIRGLNRIKSRKGVPITFSGGEPFLHPDFIPIINGLNPDLEIDISTNLYWGKGLEKFIKEVPAERLRRESPYPSIRVSYHPEQMGSGERLFTNVKRMKDAGFDIGIYSVLYPSPEHLQAITQMQFRCADEGILFRVKDFTGTFKGLAYGDYSRYPGAAFSNQRENRLCKISELLIGPDMSIYRCHRDLYADGGQIGNLSDFVFKIENKFRECANYGGCHPCDVKVKTNYKQQRGYTSVKITKDDSKK